MDSWFWEYTLEYWMEEQGMEIGKGFVYASSFSDAAAKLEHYYGKDIEEIRLLKPVFEGDVFDFNDAKEDGCCFDFPV